MQNVAKGALLIAVRPFVFAARQDLQRKAKCRLQEASAEDGT